MDDWEKYEQLADTPKYRDDFEFAMYGATHFGMKAIPILATAPIYGDRYPEIIKAACEKSLSMGNHLGRTSDIDRTYLKRSGLEKITVVVNLENELIYPGLKFNDSPSFNLVSMSNFCDQRINEIKAERLHEKICNKLAVKPSPQQRGIKI